MNKSILSRKFLAFSLALVFSVSIFSTVTSCKDREEDPNESVNVQFQVKYSTGVNVDAIITQVGTVQSTQFNIPSTPTTWNSEPQIVHTSKGAVHLSAIGDGVDSDSELIVNIMINGEMKATDTAKGLNLLAETVFDFKK